MKHKLFNIALVALVLCAGVMAGAATGQAIPDLGALGRLASPAPASASALTVEAKAPPAPLTPTGTGFTYQGSLKSGGNPANGDYDFVFNLYDAPSGGSQVGSPSVITLTNQTVTAGLFTLSLDFGSSAFDGNGRYLEIAVRQSGGGSYTTLSPRQTITPVPYSLFALKTAPYKNMIVVAQSGGQFSSISAALNSITDASSTNHYLVWVGPGTYSEQVAMKEWVDIEGAGEKATKITFTGGPNPSNGTVLGADNAELRFLTVENTGGNLYAVAILNSLASPRLLNVTATASGAIGNYGVNTGIANYTSSPAMTNVIATAASGAGTSLNVGVSNSNSSPDMTNVTATASGGLSTFNYGVDNFNSSPRIVTSIISASGGTSSYGVYSQGVGTTTTDNSQITGSTNTIYNDSSATTRVGASRLSGGDVSNAGTLTCSASYDGNNKRLGTLCTPDTNVVYVAHSGGDFTSIQSALNSIVDASATNAYLIKVGPGTYIEQVTMKPYVDIEGSGENATMITYTGSSGPASTVEGANNAELRFVTVENTGGNTWAIAIYNGSASPSLLHVTATASGGSSNNFGVYNFSSSPNMTNVTATASGSGGSTVNRAVVNELNSSPNMTSVTATASGSGGSTDNIGVANFSGSSPRIVTGIISASGAGSNSGVLTDGAGTVTIESSTISVPNTGTTLTVSSGATVRVGSSQLSGGPVFNTGTLTCAGVHDENYVFFASTCP